MGSSHFRGCWLKYGQSGTEMTKAMSTPPANVSIIVLKLEVTKPSKKLATAKKIIVNTASVSDSFWPSKSIVAVSLQLRCSENG
eukprot:scaffold86514_cov42-Prasinocladus_malaysianus.AAC.1